MSAPSAIPLMRCAMTKMPWRKRVNATNNAGVSRPAAPPVPHTSAGVPADPTFRGIPSKRLPDQFRKRLFAAFGYDQTDIRQCYSLLANDLGMTIAEVQQALLPSTAGYNASQDEFWRRLNRHLAAQVGALTALHNEVSDILEQDAERIMARRLRTENGGNV